MALGYLVCDYVRVRSAPGQLPKVADLATRLPQAAECHRFISVTESSDLSDRAVPQDASGSAQVNVSAIGITGEDCFVTKAIC